MRYPHNALSHRLFLGRNRSRKSQCCSTCSYASTELLLVRRMHSTSMCRHAWAAHGSRKYYELTQHVAMFLKLQMLAVSRCGLRANLSPHAEVCKIKGACKGTCMPAHTPARKTLVEHARIAAFCSFCLTFLYASDSQELNFIHVHPLEEWTRNLVHRSGIQIIATISKQIRLVDVCIAFGDMAWAQY